MVPKSIKNTFPLIYTIIPTSLPAPKLKPGQKRTKTLERRSMGGCFSDVRAAKEAVGVSALQQEPNDAVQSFLNSRGLRGLYTEIELSLSASKLRDRDILSKSDPMAIVYARKQGGMLEEIGRTEVMMNSLDPVWITKFVINYQFEMVQTLVFRIYDIDSEYHKTPVKMLQVDKQDFLGEASCVLSEIVTKSSRSLTLNLQSQNGQGGLHFGTLTVHAEETIASRTVIEMTLRCSNLENKDVFSKSDPFLRISRFVETGESIPIYKTEVINNNLNPVWKPVILTTQQFGSKENPLVIECFHFKNNGQHDILGMFQGSVAVLEKLHRERVGENLFVPSVSADHKKIHKGQIYVDKFLEKPRYSFLDYISSGFELNFMVAIDFTASNGNPNQFDSLHYINYSGRLNSYQQAIAGVGDVIQFYDSDRHFPAWGFGGKLVNGSVSHCFNLNGTPDQCEVTGVEGIMSAYKMALHNVSLSGPTLFGTVINRAAEIASKSLTHNTNKYFVLLIITDGVITDIQETTDAIVRASELPLSILIVGVGGADFKQMEVLDADTRRLVSSSGRMATRDIVQFVPMREMLSEISIAESLLEELPGQFLTYMRDKGIEPSFAHR